MRKTQPIMAGCEKELIPSFLQPLADEARNCKTAEEFCERAIAVERRTDYLSPYRGQPAGIPLFHRGSNEPEYGQVVRNAILFPTKVFNNDSDQEAIAQLFGEQKANQILEAEQDTDRVMADELSRQGYDAIGYSAAEYCFDFKPPWVALTHRIVYETDLTPESFYLLATGKAKRADKIDAMLFALRDGHAALSSSQHDLASAITERLNRLQRRIKELEAKN